MLHKIIPFFAPSKYIYYINSTTTSTTTTTTTTTNNNNNNNNNNNIILILIIGSHNTDQDITSPVTVHFKSQHVHSH